MPVLSRTLTQEDVKAAGPVSRQDLTPYIEMIDTVREGGVGGIVTLGEGEARRTEKRRLSLAAKKRKLKLTWRKAADSQQLRFVIAAEGENTPGGRKRIAKPTPVITDQPETPVVATETPIEAPKDETPAPDEEPVVEVATAKKRSHKKAA